MKKIILLLLFLTGCANLPTGYNQRVKIVGGIYKGYDGVLVGDCPGIENYKIKLFNNNRKVCIRVWDLERD